MQIQIDSREKKQATKLIEKYFKTSNIEYFRSKLYVGDYMSFDNPRLVIDRKQNLNELCYNICYDHTRFRNELIRAYQAHIRVIILVEHGEGIKQLEDIIFWDNPRKAINPKAMKGEVLYKVLKTIERKYDCQFAFCEKKDTGAEIVRLLQNV